MARTKNTKEWIGTNDDAAVPKTIKDRVMSRCNQICAGCNIYVRYGGQIDHVVALANFIGTPEIPTGNRESNLQFLCKACHTAKTGKDVAEHARIRRKRIKQGPIAKEPSQWSQKLKHYQLKYNWKLRRYIKDGQEEEKA